MTEIRTTYGIDEPTAQTAVAAIGAIDHDDAYSLKQIGTVLRQVAKDYGLSEKRGRVAAIVVALMLARGLSVASTAALGAFAAAPSFQLDKFAGMQAAPAGSDLFGVLPDWLLEDVFTSHTINEQVAELLFFGTPEQLSKDAMQELLRVTDSGKLASRTLLSQVATTVIGGAVGMVAALALLTAINPVMGVVGLASLPFMYVFARRAAHRGAAMRAREGADQREVGRRFSMVTRATDLLRSSPVVEPLARELRALMDHEDQQASLRGKSAAWGRFVSVLPYHVGAAVAGLIGAFVLHLPVGAIFASTLVAGWLHFPIKQVLALYSETAPPLVHDIRRMHRMLPDATTRTRHDAQADTGRLDAAPLRNTRIDVSGVRDGRITVPPTDFIVEQGEFVGIAGGSATGKSTLLGAIAALTRFENGEIRIGGVPVNDVDRRQGTDPAARVLGDAIAFMPQDTPVLLEDTLLENLLLGSRMRACDETRALATRGLRELGLERFEGQLDQPVRYASGGEQTRIALLRVLFRDANVLLLDEPTKGLGDGDMKRVVAFLRREHRRGRTVIVASHDKPVLDAAQRVITVDGTVYPAAARAASHALR